MLYRTEKSQGNELSEWFVDGTRSVTNPTISVSDYIILGVEVVRCYKGTAYTSWYP